MPRWYIHHGLMTTISTPLPKTFQYLSGVQPGSDLGIETASGEGQIGIVGLQPVIAPLS